jgi:transcriptional regulator
MYVHKFNKQEDTAEVKNFIRHNGFGILVNQTAGKLWATHIPLQLSHDGQKLLGHISRANPQWKNFIDQEEVMAIFNGPHTYISSSWYNHENVPTWNYIAVHVYGTVRIIEGDELYQSLKHLVDKYEAKSEKPVSIEKMSSEYVHREMRGIVGFEITITDIHAAYKLSQNRDAENYHNVVEQLDKHGDYNAKAVAEAMKKNRPEINQK